MAASHAPETSVASVAQRFNIPLVEGETQIAAARQLSYHALALRDSGRSHTVEAAMVKSMASKTAFDVIHQCALTLGHYGWSMDAPHQQRMRDVMGLEIADGTAGVMKMIVARACRKSCYQGNTFCNNRLKTCACVYAYCYF